MVVEFVMLSLQHHRFRRIVNAFAWTMPPCRTLSNTRHKIIHSYRHENRMDNRAYY